MDFAILAFLCHIGGLLLIVNKISIFQILFLINILGNKINFMIFLTLIYIIPIISYYLVHISFYLYYKIKKDFKSIELKRLNIYYYLSYDIFTPVMFICLFILFFPINIIQCIVYLIFIFNFCIYDGTWFPLLKIYFNYPRYSKLYWFWLSLGNYGKEGDLREIDRLLKIFITDKKSNWIYEYFIFRLILAISYGIIVIDLNFVNIYPFYLLLFILLLWNLKNILKRFIFNKKIRENIEKFSIRLDDLVTFCLLCFYGLFYLIPLIDIAINGIFFCYIIIWLFSFIIHVIIIPLLVDRPILPIKMKTNKR
ncbi:MAG: hypothetical protein ACTSRP_20905 [Candidatus Helarchaeota archaeon]